jgi:hypothetical protein
MARSLYVEPAEEDGCFEHVPKVHSVLCVICLQLQKLVTEGQEQEWCTIVARQMAQSTVYPLTERKPSS